MSDETRTQVNRGRTRLRGPRCVATGRAEMTDICGDVRTLSQMLMLCERRFADSLSAGDPDKAGKWANVGHALLAALRPTTAPKE